MYMEAEFNMMNKCDTICFNYSYILCINFVYESKFYVLKLKMHWPQEKHCLVDIIKPCEDEFIWYPTTPTL